jgi:dipeptidyl aminopeptidase/acylaminoacyl peptidase
MSAASPIRRARECAWVAGARRAAPAALASALVATLFAATPAPEPLPDVLEEVVVAGKTDLPLEAFVEFPRYDSVAISPGGTRLAMGWTEDNFQRLLTTTEFPSMKRVDSQLLQANNGAVTDLRWVTERRLIVQPDYPVTGFRRVREPIGSLYTIDIERHSLQAINTDPLMSFDPLGDQRREDEAAARPRRNPRQAGKPDGGKKPAKDAQGPLRLVAGRTGLPDQTLFQTTRTDRNGNTDAYGAYVLNLQDNRQSRIATLPLAGGRFVTGPDHRPVLVTGVNVQNEQVVYYLPKDARADGRDWQLRVSSAGGARGLRPVAWTGNGEEYYALDGRDAPMRAVVIWNAETNTQRLLYRHPVADMDTFALDPAGRPWMFAGSDHFPVYWYPDPAHPLAQLHQGLVKRLPREQIEVLNASDDLSVAVVRISSGRRTPAFIVMDVKTGKSLTGMQTYPRLRGTRLAPVDAIEFLSDDGLLIRGYLTTPVDASNRPRRGLPLVVIAHGGPQAEASDSRYEFERQLFASRGYAVLQVNHRGSSGRGEAFERAGDHKWGREVQADIAAGVRWAIRDGVAAADRICFYGIRYGAYSAMMTAAREPAMFKCVIGVTGIYDLPGLLGNGKEEIPPLLRQVLGSGMEELKSRSPVSNAAAIKARVLLMQQQNDAQAPPDQFNRMRVALRAAGNPPQTETIGQEYNGIYSPETRAAVYAKILRFLDQNIGH